MEKLLELIEETLNQPALCGKTHLITIDGRAGSGKTTFASALATFLARRRTVELLHLDDVYSGWESALGSKLTTSLSSIRKAICEGRSAEIQIFNWKTETFDSVRKIHPSDVLLIEGVGSGQTILRDSVTTSIWLDIEPLEGMARVLERDGSQIKSYMSIWQISEEEHFMREQTRENADFILSTE